jgi:hypothetical protein
MPGKPGTILSSASVPGFVLRGAGLQCGSGGTAEVGGLVMPDGRDGIRTAARADGSPVF